MHALTQNLNNKPWKISIVILTEDSEIKTRENPWTVTLCSLCKGFYLKENVTFMHIERSCGQWWVKGAIPQCNDIWREKSFYRKIITSRIFWNTGRYWYLWCSWVTVLAVWIHFKYILYSGHNSSSDPVMINSFNS